MSSADDNERFDLLKSHVAELDQQIAELKAECPKLGLAAEIDTRRLMHNLEWQKEKDQDEMDQIKTREAYNIDLGL